MVYQNIWANFKNPPEELKARLFKAKQVGLYLIVLLSYTLENYEDMMQYAQKAVELQIDGAEIFVDYAQYAQLKLSGYTGELDQRYAKTIHDLLEISKKELNPQVF